MKPVESMVAHAPRLVLVDDHPIVLEALAMRARSAAGDCQIVYSGASVRDAVQATLVNGCDCAIVDVGIVEGVAEVEIISAFTMHGIPVVAYADRGSANGCEAAIAAGARGYVDKRGKPSDIERAITEVIAGRCWIPDDIARMTLDLGASNVVLSDQERRALILYASGLTQDMVARRMGIASSTVKHYLDRVRDKYCTAGVVARTKLELNAAARADGLIA